MTDLIYKEINKTEIVKNRSERNKIFSVGQRKRLLECHCKPIHYEDGLAGWQDIRCDLMDATGRLETDRNRVKTSIRHDQFAGNVLGFEDRQNRLIRFTPLRVDVNGLKLADLGPTKQFRSISQTSPHEVLDVVSDDLSIEHYINEMGGKMWFVLPQMPQSFNITIQVDLAGDLACLNTLGEDGYYIPDSYGRFNFGSVATKEPAPVFWIKRPYWIGDGEHFLSVFHRLSNIGGTLVYEKYSTEQFSKDREKVVGPIRIDVNTYYADSGDGWVYNAGGYADPWYLVRNAGSGDSVDTDDGYLSDAASASYVAGITPYRIKRSFFRFNTADLPDACVITDADQYLYGVTEYDSSVCAQQGTQGTPLTVNDFDAFSGDEFGHVTWAIGDNTIEYNEDGIAAISKTGYTDICCREYTHDYLDSIPTTSYKNGFRFSDYTGTDNDPKLNVTYSLGSPPNVNQPMWF